MPGTGFTNAGHGVGGRLPQLLPGVVGLEPKVHRVGPQNLGQLYGSYKDFQSDC